MPPHWPTICTRPVLQAPGGPCLGHQCARTRPTQVLKLCMSLVWVPMSIKAPWHEYRGAYPRPLRAFYPPGWTIISNNGVFLDSLKKSANTDQGMTIHNTNNTIHVYIIRIIHYTRNLRFQYTIHERSRAPVINVITVIFCYLSSHARA